MKQQTLLAIFTSENMLNGGKAKKNHSPKEKKEDTGTKEG